MSYTFDISFNGSDYISFTPTNFPKVTVEKQDGYVWLTSIDEIQIDKALTSVYDTLETWYDDSTKYALDINIRIQKNAVTKWTTVFGIKSGEVDYELKTFKVSPEVVDQYSDLMYYKNRVCANALGKTYHYNDEDDATPEEIYGATVYRYEDWMASVVSILNGLSSNTYTKQSAFLWNDNYPDETSPGSLNYVSSDVNYLNDWAISRSNDYTSMGVIPLEEILDLPKQFQCYWYCASDYTIHHEHVSWFNDQIADYQLDLTGSDYYDDDRIFRYSSPEVFSVENFFFPTDNEADDHDGVEIVYEPQLVLYRSEKVEVRTDYDAYLASDFADLAKFQVVGSTDLGIGWRSSTFDTWTEGSGLNVTEADASTTGRLALSNYLATNTNQTINYSIDLIYDGIPSNEYTLQGYNGATPVGSPVTLLGSGNQSGTVQGDTIGIASTGAENNVEFTLSVSITGRYRIPWETGEISSSSLPNNYLSWANNLNRFWKYDRYALSGEMNESTETFESSKFVKEQNEFKFYYAGDIDPMRGIKTDYGTGMIQSYTRDLATDFITVKLRYE